MSTHWLRRTARAARDHYEWLQMSAVMNGMDSLHSRAACKALGITQETEFEVERAFHERGKWRVVAK